MDNYEVHGWISEGRFGTVSRAVDKRTGVEVAIKEIYFREASRKVRISSVILENAWTKSILREIQCLADESPETQAAIHLLKKAVDGFENSATKHANSHGKIVPASGRDGGKKTRMDQVGLSGGKKTSPEVLRQNGKKADFYNVEKPYVSHTKPLSSPSMGVSLTDFFGAKAQENQEGYHLSPDAILSPDFLKTGSSLNSHPKNTPILEPINTPTIPGKDRGSLGAKDGGLDDVGGDGGLDDDNDGVDWAEWNRQYNEGVYEPKHLKTLHVKTSRISPPLWSGTSTETSSSKNSSGKNSSGSKHKSTRDNNGGNSSSSNASAFSLFGACSDSMFLKKKRHPNIILLLDHFGSQVNPCYHLVYECCDVDLSQLHEIPYSDVKKLSRQLLNGLVELHDNRGVIHRDLKPANLLLHRNGLLKIADFGSAKKLGTQMETTRATETSCGDNSNDGYMTREICTRWYKSPEQLFGSYTYDEKVDIWSFGLVVYELLNDVPLFDGACDIEQISKIFQCLGNYWPEADSLPDFGKICFKRFEEPPNEYMEKKPFKKNSVIDCCIKLNSEQRPSASKLMRHQWYRKKRKASLEKSMVGEAAENLPFQGLYNLAQKRKKAEDDRSDDSYPENPFESSSKPRVSGDGAGNSDNIVSCNRISSNSDVNRLNGSELSSSDLAKIKSRCFDQDGTFHPDHMDIVKDEKDLSLQAPSGRISSDALDSYLFPSLGGLSEGCKAESEGVCKELLVDISKLKRKVKKYSIGNIGENWDHFEDEEDLMNL